MTRGALERLPGPVSYAGEAGSTPAPATIRGASHELAEDLFALRLAEALVLFASNSRCRNCLASHPAQAAVALRKDLPCNENC